MNKEFSNKRNFISCHWYHPKYLKSLNSEISYLLQKDLELDYEQEFTTGNPLSKSPNPTNATTGTIPRGLKNLWTEELEIVKAINKLHLLCKPQMT
jgi:hypothetical protein